MPRVLHKISLYNYHRTSVAAGHSFKMSLVVGLSFLFGIVAAVDFVSGVADFHDPHCGGRQVIVHLFEWKWTDIAAECEHFLGPKGFCGVQVSPPNEHTIITKEYHRPWWERYQPVSYKLTSRSGNEAQFKDMVTRCKAVGVRIFVDSVINHMAGLGRVGVGSAGTSFNSDNYDFPGVPFTKPNFNDRSKCPSHDGNVNNYGDPHNVRDCFLVGLTDLDGSQAYVQDKVAGYFNHLIDLGVAGFRIDAAKHMWPADIAAIQKKTKDLPEGGRPFFAMEVIDRNDGAIKVNEYFNEGYVTEFRYAQKVKEGANDLGRLAGVYDPNWGMAPSDQAFVFVDNHDTQRGNQALTYKNGDSYKRAVAFTLAYNYGFARVMSSYEFSNNEQGPPSSGDGSTKDVTINGDGSCGNGWVCEHRWHMIGNMARFRAYVDGTGVSNWRYENGVLSFSRGNKGVFAMGLNDFSITISTGLPAGQYCDLISDCAIKITVDSSGNANVKPASGSEPYVAFVAGDADAGLPTPNDQDTQATGGGATSEKTTPKWVEPNGATPSWVEPNGATPSWVEPVGTTPMWVEPTLPGSTEPPPPGYKRTILLVEAHTWPGQDVFIRGGISHDHRAGCNGGSAAGSPCSIPIRHVNDGQGPHYAKVNAWKVGDSFLDWYGAEPNQGKFQGQVAQGTPGFWSTTDMNHPGYSELNTHGPHYWVVDVEMDCSKTESGFFEFKALINGGWEGNIHQSATCTGETATPPYSSINHFARCGYLNVFHLNSGTCEYHTI